MIVEFSEIEKLDIIRRWSCCKSKPLSFESSLFEVIDLRTLALTFDNDNKLYTVAYIAQYNTCQFKKEVVAI